MDDRQSDCDKALRWDKGATLSSLDLHDCDLSHVDLEGANLLNVNAQGATLRHARLTGANLSNVDLRGSDLAHANFDGCILDYARLEGANLLETSFQQARLNHANLTEATLWNTNFYQAMMNEVNMFQVHIQGCDMREATLWHADLQETFVKDTTFSGANLSEVNARACNFFLNVDMAEAFLWGSNFQGAQGAVEPEIRKARMADHCVLPDGSQVQAVTRQEVFTLPKGKLFKAASQHKQIKVLTKLVWVTAARGLDQMVEAGEYLDFSSASGVLISAVADGDVTFLLW